MKYTVSLALSLFLLQQVAAQQTVNIYNRDSTVMGSGVMINNKMDGLWKFLNPKNNELIQQGYFDDGVKEGSWIFYHPNNRKKVETEYRKDVLNGSFREYDTEGALILENIYQDSVLVGPHRQYYGRAGRPGNKGKKAKINIARIRAAYGFIPVLLIMIVGSFPP